MKNKNACKQRVCLQAFYYFLLLRYYLFKNSFLFSFLFIIV